MLAPPLETTGKRGGVIEKLESKLSTELKLRENMRKLHRYKPLKTFNCTMFVHIN